MHPPSPDTRGRKSDHGSDDAWTWWALAGGAVAMAALVVSVVARRRGWEPPRERSATAVAGFALAWTAFALVRLMA